MLKEEFTSKDKSSHLCQRILSKYEQGQDSVAYALFINRKRELDEVGLNKMADFFRNYHREDMRYTMLFEVVKQLDVAERIDIAVKGLEEGFSSYCSVILSHYSADFSKIDFKNLQSQVPDGFGSVHQKINAKLSDKKPAQKR